MNQYDEELDNEDGIVLEEKKENTANWLVPLLLIPVFIIVGWTANDLLTPERQS